MILQGLEALGAAARPERFGLRGELKTSATPRCGRPWRVELRRACSDTAAVPSWDRNIESPAKRVHLVWRRSVEKPPLAWWVQANGYCVIRQPGWRQLRSGPETDESFVQGNVLPQVFNVDASELDHAVAAVGMARFYRRVYRNVDGLQREADEDAWRASVASLSLLLRELADVLAVVEPSPSNFATYGHRLRQLLLLACTDVEAAWVGTLRANGAPQSRLTTSHYVQLLPVMRLSEWALMWPAYPSLGEFRPFGCWDPARPTQSLGWYDAYNRAKHDREGALDAASLKSVLDAVAATLVMLVAQFGERDVLVGVPGLLTPTFSRRPQWAPADRYVGPTDRAGSTRNHGQIRWEPTSFVGP